MADGNTQAIADKSGGESRPRRWKYASLSSILVLLACIAGYYLGSLAVAGLPQRSVQLKLETVNGLAIDPDSLDLGEVWETPNHSLTLKVQNVSNEVRSIINFSGSCGCLKVEPQRLTISPGQTAELSLALDLTHRLPYQVGLAQWPISVRFNPVFQGDFASTPGWELKGLVRSRVSLDTLQIPFTDQCIYNGPPVTRKVRAKAHVPLEHLEASAVPPLATVRVESIPESPDSFVILVSPNPQLPVGPFTFEVQVKAVMPDGEVHRCASIEASGEMQPSTGVFPRLILLGEQAVTNHTEAEISVRLPSNGWSIDHLETDGSDTTVARAGTQPDGSEKLHLTQRISRLGDRISHIRILIRKPDKQTETLTVEVRYYGMPQPRPEKSLDVSTKQP
jgi:Protein of unknown function (DUF1573)